MNKDMMALPEYITPKIKTRSAEIVVDGPVDNPYYSIKWLDEYSGTYYIGYGSYRIDYVRDWLSKCFEIAEEQPKTNAEYIRSMSDEELANLIAYGKGCLLKAPHCMSGNCHVCYLNWLKQPYKENTDE